MLMHGVGGSPLPEVDLLPVFYLHFVLTDFLASPNPSFFSPSPGKLQAVLAPPFPLVP